MRLLIAAIMATFIIAPGIADAKARHHHHRQHAHLHRPAGTQNSQGPTYGGREDDARSFSYAQISGRRHQESRGGRPGGCPSAWCGCWLAQHLGLNRISINLNLAWNWSKIGHQTSPQPGAVAVWPHHVGLVKGVRRGNRGLELLLLSGNDGHAVRERWRLAKNAVYRAL